MSAKYPVRLRLLRILALAFATSLVPMVGADLGWCLKTDYKGVVAATDIRSMTIDAEEDPETEVDFIVVGGLATFTTSDEGFLYSLVDSDGECGLRHSYRISSMDLGIQAVSISESYVWAIGLSTGDATIGVSDKTNVIFRVDKNSGGA